MHLHHKHGSAPDASTLAGSDGRAAPALSAHHSVQFGQDYGVWLKEWHLLQRSVVVIDRTDRIVYVEYVTDQMSEPDYTAAIQAVQCAAKQ